MEIYRELERNNGVYAPFVWLIGFVCGLISFTYSA